MPPIGTTENPSGVAPNASAGRVRLPEALSSFVGREREIAAGVNLLRREDVRLLTLTGPGGVGKTRLAIEIARRLEETFPAGVLLVPLGPIVDPGLVIPEIATALGAQESADYPLEEQLTRAIGTRRMLLVLDNFEHVVAAAPNLSRLLVTYPGLKAMVTSRAALRVSGEFEFPVPPMAVRRGGEEARRRGVEPVLLDSSPARLLDSDAMRLFVERARAVRPGFGITPDNAPIVADICVRLEGLPLAIELAAARIKVLAPAALQARLENRLQLLTGGARNHPARLQTMRDAIAWSYDLLDPDSQAVFRRLSVFVGGFTLEAAEYVAGETAGRPDGGTADMAAADPPSLEPLDRSATGTGSPPPVSPSRPPAAPDVLDVIALLVDNSLLRQEDAGEERRFRMLDIVREFAVERAVEHGELEVARARLATRCVAFAEEVERGFFGPDEPESFARIDRELDNLRATMAWAEERGDTALGLRLSGLLWGYWVVRRHFAEGRGWVERFLARADDETPPKVLAAGLDTAGFLAWAHGDFAGALDRHQRALPLWQALGDRLGVARTLNWLALVARYQGDYARLASWSEEGLAVAREIGDAGWTSNALAHIGLASVRRGDRATGRRFFEEAIAVDRAAGYLRGLAWALQLLADLEVEENRLGAAAELHRESLALGRDLGDRWGIFEDLYAAAELAQRAGQNERATRILAAAESLRDRAGVVPRADRATFDAAIATLATSLPHAAFTAAWDVGKALTMDEAADEAQAVFDEVAAATPAPTAARPPVVEPTAPTDSLGLTARELEVLGMLARGASTQNIADALFIAPRTVTTHVGNLLAKLGVESRGAAVAIAYRRGLVNKA